MSQAAILDELWDVISERADHPSEESYTSRILNHRKGIDKSLEKVGEEATEFIIAVKNNQQDATVCEAADLIYHLLLSLKAAHIDINAVYSELEARRKH